MIIYSYSNILSAMAMAMASRLIATVYFDFPIRNITFGGKLTWAKATRSLVTLNLVSGPNSSCKCRPYALSSFS